MDAEVEGEFWKISSGRQTDGREPVSTDLQRRLERLLCVSGSQRVLLNG